MPRTFITPYSRSFDVESQYPGVNLSATDTYLNNMVQSYIPRDVLLDMLDAIIQDARITPTELFPMGYVAPTVIEVEDNKFTAVPNITPQAKAILKHLEEVGNISNVEAQALYKCRALPRRIADLKANGHKITSSIRVDNTGQRYARYELQKAA